MEDTLNIDWEDLDFLDGEPIEGEKTKSPPPGESISTPPHPTSNEEAVELTPPKSPVSGKASRPRGRKPGKKEPICTPENPTSTNKKEKSADGDKQKPESADIMGPTPPKSPVSGKAPRRKGRKAGKKQVSISDPQDPSSSNNKEEKSPVSGKAPRSKGRKRGNDRPGLMSAASSQESDTALSQEASSSSSTSTKGKNKTRRYKKANVKTLLPVDSDDWKVGQVDDDEYIVEKVVDKKFIETENGKLLHYHIKWRGWGSAHNTWEPLVNLDGCQELVEEYESTQRPVISGTDSDESDDEGTVNHGKKDHFKKELLETLVDPEWPAHLTPIKMYGVLTVDHHLCYIVRHEAPNHPEKLSPQNCVVVRASGFRSLFPHIVISYYEGTIDWVKRAETKEELAQKAQKALETSERGMKKRAKKKTDQESMDNGVETNEDPALDEDGLPIVQSAKGGDDLAGQVEGIESDGSTSEGSEDELEELPDQVILDTKSVRLV